jgi:hypothetical protein
MTAISEIDATQNKEANGGHTCAVDRLSFVAIL